MEARFRGQTITSAESIDINLTHNPISTFSTVNSIRVQGFDSNWVTGTLKQLEEITDAFKPQNTFVWKNRLVIGILLSLSIGYVLLNFFLLPFMSLLYETSNKLPQRLVENPFLLILVAGILQILFSLALGSSVALQIQKKLLSLYPSIELQIAPDHKQIEKQRRLWVYTVITLIVLPIVIQVGYEAIKSLV
jgi:hypothetical protein